MGRASNQTKIVAVGGSGRSIRTVIPLWVAEQMDFNVGDNIRWKMKVVNGEMRVYIEKGDE
tara:strand:+ start:4391 stop:4573 length:183 start_codon:yes stop_codon:yes gene_type:complete